MNPPQAEKLDVFRLHKSDYRAQKKPFFVSPASGKYLLIAGEGAPGSELFSNRVAALYGMAFTIKMTRKFDGLGDYTICKLECRYPELAVDGSPLPPMDKWRWELFIRTPDFVGDEDLKKALAALRKRKKAGDAEKVRLDTIEEGPCIQMLHVGPYEKIGESFARMRELAEAKGQRFVGPSHEVFLSDPRRVPPEKLKTLLRMPIIPEPLA